MGHHALLYHSNFRHSQTNTPSPSDSESAVSRGTVLRDLRHHRNPANRQRDALLLGDHGSRGAQLKHYTAYRPVPLCPQPYKIGR
jgi:hypothetical protein